MNWCHVNVPHGGEGAGESMARASARVHTHLAVVDVVSGGPPMFARLLAVLPLEEVVHHGIVLGASRSGHALQETRAVSPRLFLLPAPARVFMLNQRL